MSYKAHVARFYIWCVRIFYVCLSSFLSLSLYFFFFIVFFFFLFCKLWPSYNAYIQYDILHSFFAFVLQFLSLFSLNFIDRQFGFNQQNNKVRTLGSTVVFVLAGYRSSMVSMVLFLLRYYSHSYYHAGKISIQSVLLIFSLGLTGPKYNIWSHFYVTHIV